MGAQDASFDKAGGISYRADVLSLPLPNVRSLLSSYAGAWEGSVAGIEVSLHVCVSRATFPLLCAAALGGFSAVWTNSHWRGYFPCASMIRPPHPRGPNLRGLAAWQATASWTVCQLAWQRLFPWLQVTVSMVPDAAWLGSDQGPWTTASATSPVGRLGRPSSSDPWGVGCCALTLCYHGCVRVRGIPDPLACLSTNVRVLCVLCTVSVAKWSLFTDVRAVCASRVVLVAPLGSPPLLFAFFCWLFVASCFFSRGGGKLR